MFLSSRALMSMAFFSTTLVGSMFRALSLTSSLSMIADNRLWAAVTAWMSPVKWRSMSHMGYTWE